ncbi:hypothetical protein KOXY103107_16455 [Komagataeibacter xylinus]
MMAPVAVQLSPMPSSTRLRISSPTDSVAKCSSTPEASSISPENVHMASPTMTVGLAPRRSVCRPAPAREAKVARYCTETAMPASTVL